MAYIKALSYYLPKRVVTNEELLREFPEWSVDKVAAKVGVDARHLAAPDETAGDMAEKAARKRKWRTCWASRRATSRGWKSASSTACAGRWRACPSAAPWV